MKAWMLPPLHVLGRLTANRPAQWVLGKGVRLSHHLMGIGAGGGVESSGEREVIREVARTAVPPICVFDVGANQGQFLRLVLAEAPADDLTVHCFEPGRETFAKLAGVAGGGRRVRLNQVALGREQGSAVLHYDQEGSGLASLTKRRLEHHGIGFDGSGEVAVTTIDRYCAEHGIGRIHLLRLDIEGHELDALEGARGMFGRGAVDRVTFEFGGCNIDTRTYFQDYWYFFKAYGFRIFRITPAGYLHPILKYNEAEEQFNTVNYLAVRGCGALPGTATPDD